MLKQDERAEEEAEAKSESKKNQKKSKGSAGSAADGDAGTEELLKEDAMELGVGAFAALEVA